MPPVRPVSRALLRDELAGRLAAHVPAGARLRVAVDGPPPARPGELAESLLDPLRAAGHPAVHVRTADFLRPASLRFEFGRTDPDVFYTDWLDEQGLVREVLGPAGPGGTGRVLPALFDAARDRAARVPYLTVPPGGVVLVSGAFLLGGLLPFDLTVHLELSAAALARRTPADEAWTLPAYARYAAEVGPETFADVVVRSDHPDRPALVEPAR